MAKRDPFGRLPDENPLAGLGTMSGGSTSEAESYVVPEPSSEPVFSAAPAGSKERAASDAKPESQPPPPKTGNPAVDASLAEVMRQAQQLGAGVDVTKSVRTVGRVVKLAVFLIVVAVIVSVGSSIFDASKSLRDTVGDIPSPKEIVDEATPEPSTPAEKEAAAVPAVGLSSTSMLTRRNFRRAMARLRTSGLGRMRTMSVRPDRIDAQLLTKGGSLRSVQIAAEDPTEIKDFGTGGSGFSHLETIPFARINSAVPQRLARSAAGRARVPVSRVDYLVLSSILNDVSWGAYLKGGKIFLANSRGRITRRIS